MVMQSTTDQGEIAVQGLITLTSASLQSAIMVTCVVVLTWLLLTNNILLHLSPSSNTKRHLIRLATTAMLLLTGGHIAW
jgi:hypothetical protein